MHCHSLSLALMHMQHEGQAILCLPHHFAWMGHMRLSTPRDRRRDRLRSLPPAISAASATCESASRSCAAHSRDDRDRAGGMEALSSTRSIRVCLEIHASVRAFVRVPPAPRQSGLAWVWLGVARRSTRLPSHGSDPTLQSVWSRAALRPGRKSVAVCSLCRLRLDGRALPAVDEARVPKTSGSWPSRTGQVTLLALFVARALRPRKHRWVL